MSINRSKSFETVGGTLIGLKLVLELVGPFLGRDVTSAHFSSSGKDEFSMQSLNIFVNGSTHTSELDLRILGGIFLCVVAF